jgi:ferredoxin-nitrate reductase
VLIEKGAVDRNFIESFTNGYPAVKDAILETSLSSASEICGVPIEDIYTAAEYIGNAYNFISMWAMGLNQSSVGVDKNIALLNIHLLTGQVGKPGSGPFSLTGQPNAMGKVAIIELSIMC